MAFGGQYGERQHAKYKQPNRGSVDATLAQLRRVRQSDTLTHASSDVAQHFRKGWATLWEKGGGKDVT